MFTDKELTEIGLNEEMILDQRVYENPSTGFSIHYLALKNQILLADVRGVSNGEDVVNYFKLRDELITSIKWDMYAEVRQNHEGTTTTQSGRREIIRYYSNLDYRCRALIYTNISFVVRLQIKTGKLLIRNKHLQITIAETMADGIKMAVQLIGTRNRGISRVLNRRPEWGMDTGHGKVEYVFIEPDIVYVVNEGDFFYCDYERLRETRLRFYADTNLDKSPFFKIMDFSRLKYAEVRIKRQVFIDNLEEEKSGLMRANCLIKSDVMMRSYVLIAKALFKKHTSRILADSLDEALKKIDELRQGIKADQDRKIVLKESDFKKILNLIQAINWDIEDTVVLEECENPEIKEALEMLFIMRSDIQEYVKQLNLKYSQLEEETSRRRNAELVLSEKNLELTETRNHIISIFNTIKDGVSIIDSDGYLQDCNNAYLQMFGLQRERIHGVNVFHSYPAEDAERLKNYFNGLHCGKKSVCRLRKTNAAGELIDVAVTSSIMQIKQSSDFMIVSVVADISEQVRNEQELVDRNRQLETAMEELQKSQETLVRQEKLASLGTMVAGIAHEINNPAQAIKFSLESLSLNIADIRELAEEVLALSDLPPDQQLENLPKLKNVVNYLNLPEIIKELEQVIAADQNALERIENIVMSTKRMSYADANFTDCNINEIVNDALTLVNNQVKYQVHVEVKLQPDLPLVYALNQELGQVVINFIINARDAIVEKGLEYKDGCIMISTYYTKENDRVNIVIADNGSGIRAEYIAKLYDPFFTTKPLGKGTGLGLNIAHRIVESHGGDIFVATTEGVGTTFTVSLPVKRERRHSQQSGLFKKVEAY